jgi:putative nucleotidyltransferase with HDIG domain
LPGLEKELAGVEDPLSFLGDPHNWVSSEVCRIMYANARRITGDERTAFKIGFESVTHKRLGYIQEILLKAWASPQSTAKRIRSINKKFNRNKEVELVSHGKKGAVVRLLWRRDLELGRDFCLVNQGVYSAMTTIWDLAPAKVVETECQFKGGKYCEFVVTWQTPSLLHRIKLLGASQRGLLADTLAEMERDKRLLGEKYAEVQGLNLHLQEKIDQMLSIQQASTAILAELDYQQLMPTVLKLFVKAIGYRRGMIMMVSREDGVLRFVQGVGVDPEALEALSGYEIPLSRKSNILARVAQNGRPLICPDASHLDLNPENIIIRSYQPQSIVILPLAVHGKVIGVLAADRSQAARDDARLSPEYLQVFANQVALAIENARMYGNLRTSFLSTLKSLAQALEAKDPYTRGHSERVGLYAARLAQRLNLPPETIEQVRNGCILHDIGKIGVERRILNKKAKLQPDEFEIIRGHAVVGRSIVEPLNLSPDEAAIVRNHHERYDGMGYPDGLRGAAIPMAVRVVTVADAFDAMTSDRPYRKALDVQEALRRLEEGANRQFDPYVVSAFATLVRRGEAQGILAQNRSPAGEVVRLTAV